jgi:hypothetical protein
MGYARIGVRIHHHQHLFKRHSAAQRLSSTLVHVTPSSSPWYWGSIFAYKLVKAHDMLVFTVKSTAVSARRAHSLKKALYCIDHPASLQSCFCSRHFINDECRLRRHVAERAPGAWCAFA